jgi:hypothetical protein
MTNKVLILVCSYFFCLSLVFGQDYFPFKSNQYKRFHNQTNSTDNDYFFYPSTVQNNDSIFFFLYLRWGNTFVDVTNTQCQGWGGGTEAVADTTWLGRKIIYDVTNQYLLLFNKNMDTLSFNFDLQINDSSIFYKKNNENYFIKYVSKEQETILNFLDSIKTFVINKYDDLGNLVPDELTGYELKLGKKLGLISFIDCLLFPTEKKKLNLMGQSEPMIGYYQLTYDELFPFHSGDTLEFYGSSDLSNIGTRTIGYNLVTINNRIETLDEITIYFENKIFLQNIPNGAPSYPSPYIITYPTSMNFKKNESFSYVPDKYLNLVSYFTSSSICDDREYLSRSDKSHYMYCEPCDCFIPYDGDGQSFGNERWVKGLGRYSSSSYEYSDFGNDSYSYLIYSNVGGVQCGEVVYVGLDDLKLENNQQIIKRVDILGREIDEFYDCLQFHLYDNGVVKKIYKVQSQ